jgi:hypothetical protein
VGDERRPGRARVVFDDVLWRDDLAHASEAGQLAATTMREELARDGARIDLLRPCEAEARDGTCLPGCMKLYVPAPAGRWESSSSSHTTITVSSSPS